MKEKRNAAIVALDLNAVKQNGLDVGNPFHIKEQGNSRLLCFDNCSEAAETALNLRRTTGIPAGIGIHFGQVSCEYEGDAIRKVSGEPLISAARIEPIVEPDKIYCSKSFHERLEAESAGRFEAKDIGFHQLALGYGGLHLFELTEKRDTN